MTGTVELSLGSRCVTKGVDEFQMDEEKYRGGECCCLERRRSVCCGSISIHLPPPGSQTRFAAIVLFGTGAFELSFRSFFRPRLTLPQSPTSPGHLLLLGHASYTDTHHSLSQALTTLSQHLRVPKMRCRSHNRLRPLLCIA